MILFFLGWCRENSLIPLYQENESITIAIGNIIFIGTIGSSVKNLLSQSGLKCKFVERSIEEINEILDLTLDKKFLSGDPKYLEFKRKKVIEEAKKAIEKEKKEIEKAKKLK